MSDTPKHSPAPWVMHLSDNATPHIEHGDCLGAVKTYEVTTTVTITRKHVIEADGEETAKEQAEERTLAHVANSDPWELASYVHMEQEAVEITSPKPKGGNHE